jgi:hypothetical protein
MRMAREPLSRGVVFIQYHTENLDVVPVFGLIKFSEATSLGIFQFSSQ